MPETIFLIIFAKDVLVSPVFLTVSDSIAFLIAEMQAKSMCVLNKLNNMYPTLPSMK